MYIISKNEFLFSNLLLENLNISNELLSNIKEIDNPVSNFISYLHINNDEKKPYMTDYLDVSNEFGYFNFKSGKIKIGRTINQLINKSKRENINVDLPTEKDVQEFIKIYNDKFLTDDVDNNKFEIVKGDDIYEIYQMCGRSGTLEDSCMVYAPENFFDIYVRNNNISILVMVENDTLFGRAILWKTDKGVFMDRIYYIDETVLVDFKKYAKSNNIKIKERQDSHKTNIKMVVELEVVPQYFPYLDTFKYLDSVNKKLYSYYNNNIDKFLESTNGEYEPLYPNKNYFNRYSDEEKKVMTTLDLESKYITDISDIKDFVNLKYLYLNNNNISDISNVQYLTNLETLYISNNNISDISAIKDLTNLEYLYLYDNNISDISAIKDLRNLRYLHINNITDVEIGKINNRNLYIINENVVGGNLPQFTFTGVNYGSKGGVASNFGDKNTLRKFSSDPTINDKDYILSNTSDIWYDQDMVKDILMKYNIWLKQNNEISIKLDKIDGKTIDYIINKIGYDI